MGSMNPPQTSNGTGRVRIVNNTYETQYISKDDADIIYVIETQQWYYSFQDLPLSVSDNVGSVSLMITGPDTIWRAINGQGIIFDVVSSATNLPKSTPFYFSDNQLVVAATNIGTKNQSDVRGIIAGQMSEDGSGGYIGLGVCWGKIELGFDEPPEWTTNQTVWLGDGVCQANEPTSGYHVPLGWILDPADQVMIVNPQAGWLV